MSTEPYIVVPTAKGTRNSGSVDNTNSLQGLSETMQNEARSRQFLYSEQHIVSDQNGDCIVEVTVPKATRADDDTKKKNKRRKRRSTGQRWTNDEDAKLKQYVLQAKASNEFEGEDGFWTYIAECLGSREATQCASRWKNMLDPALVKGAWTKEVCGFVVMYAFALSPRV